MTKEKKEKEKSSWFKTAALYTLSGMYKAAKAPRKTMPIFLAICLLVMVVGLLGSYYVPAETEAGKTAAAVFSQTGEKIPLVAGTYVLVVTDQGSQVVSAPEGVYEVTAGGVTRVTPGVLWDSREIILAAE